ncbi:tail fiber domain-containing protein [Candidatus Roizmanbacteria bacterium]|nr:MAG: tail fiber domain-containing protein [Candidatus Roizmanbacteria bacterium]
MQKKKFIPPSVSVEEIQLNLFSRYHDDTLLEGLLMNEVYAASNSLYLPIIYSDKSLKVSVKPLKNSISRVMKLEPVTYTWKGTSKESAGLIAQNVRDVLPESVVETSGLLRVDYAGVISLLVQAVQDQQKEIDSLKKRLTDKS